MSHLAAKWHVLLKPEYFLTLTFLPHKLSVKVGPGHHHLTFHLQVAWNFETDREVGRGGVRLQSSRKGC